MIHNIRRRVANDDLDAYQADQLESEQAELQRDDERDSHLENTYKEQP